ncbi:ATP-grasp domain-containing protein [Hyphococcus luteus]|uniref:Biotin carboxylase n=1 Tax=Hyphococcus luteus TaxID=2058213 RepID=A0A2S7K688_9PROT|nr:ATP-grasp domain-containing protein [Marinicaulis flavus]PQA87991.1 biotin carboxylase [Marinicaulis flavus]
MLMNDDLNSRLARGRVIVTYGRSLMSLAIARSLHERGVEVIGCDDVGMTALSFSKNISGYFTHPVRAENPDAFLDKMVEQAKKYQPGDDRPYVLMPTFEGMRFFSEHRDRFDGIIDIAAPDFAAIDRVDPKDHLMGWAGEQDLPAPQTVKVTSEREVREAAEKVRFPVMLKAPDKVGGRGVTKAANAGELMAQYKKLTGDRALVQEFLEGVDYCHTVIFENGVLKGSMAYKNLRQWPRTSGAGVVRETVDDAPFLETSKKLLGPLGWNGVAEIDYRWTEKEGDEARLIEVNPRFWAGLYHSIASGVDFPWMLYELTVTGGVLSNYEQRVGEKTRIPGVAMLSAVNDIAHSETDFTRLREAWRDAGASLKEGHVGEAVKRFARSVGGVIDRDDIAFELFQAVHEVRGARGELSFKEDRMANLGFLYVVSSLVRHGELPPEMKH